MWGVRLPDSGTCGYPKRVKACFPKMGKAIFIEAFSISQLRDDGCPFLLSAAFDVTNPLQKLSEFMR